jgi:hypothetical protein
MASIEYKVKDPCGEEIKFTSNDEGFIRENCVLNPVEMAYKCKECGKEHDLEVEVNKGD